MFNHKNQGHKGTKNGAENFPELIKKYKPTDLEAQRIQRKIIL